MSSFAITLDFDWAPDFAIKKAIDILVKYGVKATFFATHSTPMLQLIENRSDLFEIGIHPNFLPGSSHGKTEREVLGTMKMLVPQAKSMRAHAFMQSSPILLLAQKEFGITVDSSLLLPKMPHILPHCLYLDHNILPLMRIPIFFEDDVEAYSPRPCWEIEESCFQVPGLKVFNFHPVYIYLNASRMYLYRELKKAGNLWQMTERDFEPFVQHNEDGAGTLFEKLCRFLGNQPVQTKTLQEIAHDYFKE